VAVTPQRTVTNIDSEMTNKVMLKNAFLMILTLYLFEFQ